MVSEEEDEMYQTQLEEEYKKKGYLDSSFEDYVFVSGYLNKILGILRAQYLSYQTSHWQVRGGSFYGNHLLFERLYNSVTEQVDSLAEKIAGLIGSEFVDLAVQVPVIEECLFRWAPIECNHERGLASESELQDALSDAYEEIAESGMMTLGLDDWIMATANQHEGNQYLLQQALRQIKQASGDVQPEDVFFPAPQRKEVLEFADSGALSNEEKVVENAAKDRELSQPLPVEIKEVEEAPPPPSEILEMPGADDLSTLNRYVIDAENPNLNSAIRMNEKREAIRKLLANYQFPE